MDFNGEDAFTKALECNGSDLDGYSLYVDEAKPRESGGFSGGGGGGFSGGGGFGGRGGRGGRDSGGRGGGRFSGGRGGRDGGRRGGRGGGRGGGRFGTPNRFSAGTASSGKLLFLTFVNV